MNKLQFLQARVSVSKLQSPAPNDQVLLEVFKAASRAADHGLLKPWRFLIIKNHALTSLGDLFANAAKKNDPDISPSVVEKCRNMPLRAPMIIVAIARCQLHPKVPKHEQLISCGAAVQNMLNAFFVLGFGAIWRTGEMACDNYINQELGLGEGEEIVGFVYVGTPLQAFPNPPEIDVSKLFQEWPNK